MFNKKKLIFTFKRIMGQSNRTQSRTMHNITLPPLEAFIHTEPIISSKYGKVFRTAYIRDDKSYQCVAKLIETAAPSEYEKVIKLDHPNIIKPVGLMKGDKYIVFYDYYEFGNLRQHIIPASKRPPLSSMPNKIMIKTVFKQMVETVSYLHEHDIIHHDIKLENFLMESASKIVMIDFEHSVKVPHGHECSFWFGSPFYIAPEIYRYTYHDYRIDIWSLGVCLYYMIYGKYPYLGKNKKQVMDAVLNNPLVLPPTPIVSKRIAHLLRGMLNKDMTKRFSLKDILNHEWLQCKDINTSTPHILPSVKIVDDYLHNTM